MTDEHALQTLRDVESIRGNARSAVLWGSLPLLAFGVALLLSVPFTLGPYAGLYWLIAGPLALGVTVVGYRRLELERGLVERGERSYVLLIAAMLAASLAIGFFAGDGLASQVGPVFPIGIGLVAFGWIGRSLFEVATGALVLAIGLGLAIVAPADADTWAAIGAGTGLVVAGLIARGLARR